MLLPVLVVSFAVSPVCAASVESAPSSPVFPIFVRLSHPPTEPEKAILERTSVSGLSISVADPVVASTNTDSAPVLLDRVADRGELRWSDPEYEDSAARYLVTRDPRLTVRSTCPRRALEAGIFDPRLAEVRESKRPNVIGISVANEPSWGRDSDPSDICMCGDCIAAWRRDLATRFQSAEAAATALGIDGTSFEALEPWGVDRARAQNEGKTRTQARVGGWLDYREFLDRSMTQILADLAKKARGDSDVAAGFVGGALPNPFSGVDWSRLPRVVTLICPPRDPTSSEIACSVKRPDCRVFLPLHPIPGQAEGDFRLSRRAMFEQFFVGARGGIVEHADVWFDARVDSSSKPLPVVASNFAVAISESARFFATEGAHEWVNARDVSPRVAILYSARSLKLEWLIEAEPDGIYWPTRAARLEGEILPLAEVYWGWQLLLSDLLAPFRFLADEDLESAAGGDPLANVRVLVLPRVIAMSGAVESRIREFVAKGGTVLADADCGLFDEHGNGLLRGRLDDVFGIERKRCEAPWDEANPGDEHLADEALTKIRSVERDLKIRSPEETRAIFLDRNLRDYRALRDRGIESAIAFENGLRDVFTAAGATIPFRVKRSAGGGVPRVRVFEHESERGKLYGIVRTEFSLPDLDLGGVDAALADSFELEFDHPVFVDDLAKGAIGTAATSSYSLRLPFDGVALLRVRSQE